MNEGLKIKIGAVAHAQPAVRAMLIAEIMADIKAPLDALRARIAELEAMLSAVGAGGVGQPVRPSSKPAIINGKPATAISLLAALVDIYDDHQQNAPEHRCYVDDAWSTTLADARQFIAAPSPQAEPPQLSALQQYDLEQSPEYHRGRADGRAAGYDVGYRHAKEQLTQPTQDADSRDAEELTSQDQINMAVGHAIVMAVRDLPMYYQMRILIEQGSATVDLLDNLGADVGLYDDGVPFYEQINSATAIAAIQAKG